MRTCSLHGLALLAGTSLLLSSCATVVNSDHQSVRIFSTPSEATVTVDDRFHLSTAGTVNLSRFTDHIAVIEKDGYEPATLKIERHMSGWVWWNLWCLPAIYWCVKSDRTNGGFWTFDDDIDVELTKRAEASPAKPSTP
jgi:PEGA domain-containing protein